MSSHHQEKKVLVAMSGGVDSTVTALLLKQDGYEVTGITFNLYPQKNPQHIQDAKKAADIIQIPHLAMHLEDVFQEKIINYFVQSYMQGETPNPCVFCNKYIKFAALETKADELGIHYLATGHYAQLVPANNGKGQRLSNSADEKKSQEYFLSLIPSHVLDRLIFPLSIYKKPQVRDIANRNHLNFFGEKKDSQEICFLQNKSYTEFLDKTGATHHLQKGDILEGKTGKILGNHHGFYRYTVGQRRGLGLGAKEAMYVLETDPQQNSVTVGQAYELQKTLLQIRILNTYDDMIINREYDIKIRYKSKSQKAYLVGYEEQSQHAIFKATNGEFFQAPSKGQLAVIYKNNIVQASGKIEKSE